MALMHKTTMSPTKLELLAEWLPKQPWFAGDAAQLVNLGGYRFDDPAGEVGLEGILLTAGDDRVYHVPLTYRGAPLEGSEEFFVGSSEHGVLGTRWVTDGAGDPVFRAALAETIALGGRQADEFVEDAAGNRTTREPRVRVQGTGRPGEELPDLTQVTADEVGDRTRIENGAVVLDVVRVIDAALQASADQLALQGTWQDQAAPATLALLYAA